MKAKLEFPFYVLPKSLAARKDLKASDKVVFSVIRDYLGNNGTCWPGVRTLSKDTGLAVSTVVESIGRLEVKEVLKINRRGNGKSSHYRIPKSALKTRMVKKPKRTENQNGQETKAHRIPNTGAPKTGTEAHRKSEPNQKNLLNQTTTSNSFAFILRSKKLWHLPKVKLDEYTEAFPNLDIEYQLRKATQWLIDNPSRRKTARGMTRFLGSWLGRAKQVPGTGKYTFVEKSDEEIEQTMTEIYG